MRWNRPSLTQPANQLFQRKLEPMSRHSSEGSPTGMYACMDAGESTQGEKCDFHLASKPMTCVIDFGGTSLCRLPAAGRNTLDLIRVFL